MKDQSVYVIFSDDADAYFIRVGLGIFWECGPRSMAREFKTRAQAAKILTDNGKHRDGWRVLKVDSHRPAVWDGSHLVGAQ